MVRIVSLTDGFLKQDTVDHGEHESKGSRPEHLQIVFDDVSGRQFDLIAISRVVVASDTGG